MAAVALTLWACKGDAPPQQQAPASTATPSVRHVDGPDGLTAVIKAALEEIRTGNSERAKVLLAELALPDPDAFFSRHFRADSAGRLLADYRYRAPHLPELAELLRTQLDRGYDQVVVERFEDERDPRATGYQSKALASMTQVIPLYSVRLRPASGGDGYHLWSFVHDGDRFRWVGKLEGVFAQVASEQATLLELRVEDAGKAIPKPNSGASK